MNYSAGRGESIETSGVNPKSLTAEEIIEEIGSIEYLIEQEKLRLKNNPAENPQFKLLKNNCSVNEFSSRKARKILTGTKLQCFEIKLQAAKSLQSGDTSRDNYFLRQL